MSQVSAELLAERHKVRQDMKTLRSQIKSDRIEEAVEKGGRLLPSTFPREGYILSYASFGDEYPTTTINVELAKSGRLALPKVEGNDLDLYAVTDLETQLQPSPWGMPEPNPELCKPLPLIEVTCILVPGLGFDEDLHRIGYGKGYYDRLLEKKHDCPAYGIGFQEQYLSGKLPIAPHDLQLDAIFLF